MPKAPADPGTNPPLPPCKFTTTVIFQCQGILITGDHAYPGGLNLPPPPGGKLPPMSYIGGNTWYGDIRSGAQHWESQLHLSCPNDNGSGILTLAYSDTTGTYIGDYSCSPTDWGRGAYSGPEPGVTPLTQSITQA